MTTNVKSAEDLFQNRKEDEDKNLETSVYENETSKKAGAAQNSARSRKSSAAFRTISEVANDLGVQQHVLRFWETKFSQVKPLKRGGGRRYYRPEDINLLQAIHRLLYVEGYTIKGVQKLLREAGKKQIVDNFSDEAQEPSSKDSNHKTTASAVAAQAQNVSDREKTALNDQQRRALKSVLAELRELRGMIKPRS